MNTLYVKPSCPWCIDAINWLQQEKIKIQIVDVLKDLASYERMQQISGQSLTPTLQLADGRVLADFDTAQLKKFLNPNQ